MTADQKWQKLREYYTAQREMAGRLLERDHGNVEASRCMGIYTEVLNAMDNLNETETIDGRSQ